MFLCFLEQRVVLKTFGRNLLCVRKKLVRWLCTCINILPVVYRWCTGGVPVVYRWCTGGVPVVYRWCTDGVPVVYRWCTGGVPVVYRWCTGGVPVVYRWCTGAVHNKILCCKNNNICIDLSRLHCKTAERSDVPSTVSFPCTLDP